MLEAIDVCEISVHNVVGNELPSHTHFNFLSSKSDILGNLAVNFSVDKPQ